jgi:uncharacterized protein (DUF2062 family)
MGILPVWGFQMLIAIAVSILLKLNKALVIIAANVSIPPMIPVVIYLSHFTGRIWMGKESRVLLFSDEITLEFIHNNFLQYVYGAVTLAIAAGVTFGLITYGLLKLTKRKSANAMPAEDRD